MVHQGEVSLGTVVAFVLLLTNLFEPVQQLSQLFNTVQAAAAGLNKLFGLLDTKTDLPERKGAVDLPEHGEVHVDNVSFSYSARVRTSGCCATSRSTIAPGRALALVGPTGAGKSTLGEAGRPLLRPAAGLDHVRRGRPARRDASLAARAHRRRAPGGVPLQRHDPRQRAHRSTPTPPTPRSTPRSLSSVPTSASPCCPTGFATEVRERGSRLSAGERQLVSLARAALADPAVLVLDEATSSLDPGTEAMVERAMDRLMAGRTVIVIAHRLSTAERADRVGVVDHHDLVELGSHDELIALGGRYAALYGSWAGSACGPDSLRPCGCGSTKTCARATACASTTAPTCSCSSKTASPTCRRGSGSATTPVAAAAWPGRGPANERVGRDAALDCPGECIFIELD